jgi:hypothetical protein
MPDWAGIVLGVVILAFVYSDRRLIRRAWHGPARFSRGQEAFEARAPSQPGNLAVGVLLGVAAIAYGVYALVYVTMHCCHASRSTNPVGLDRGTVTPRTTRRAPALLAAPLA